MTLNEKLAETQKEKRQNQKNSQIKWLFILCVIGVLALIVLTVLIFIQYDLFLRFADVVRVKWMLAGAWVLGIILIVFSFYVKKYLGYGYGVKYRESQSAHQYVCYGIVALSVLVMIVLVISADFKTVFHIQDIYFDEDNGYIYYEYSYGYVLKKLKGEGTDIVLYGEVHGKSVKGVEITCPNKTQSFSIIGGEWELDKDLFSYAANLKVIDIQDATVKVKKKTFSACERLKEVRIVNSQVCVDIDSYDCESNLSDFSIFHDAGVSIYLQNSRLNNLADHIKELRVSGQTDINNKIRIPADRSLPAVTDKVVVEEETTLEDSVFMNDVLSYWIREDAFYPVSEFIVLPVSVKAIPDYFFGNEIAKKNIKVCYAGSVENWNQVTIGTVGNDNYFNGNVEMVYDYLEKK